MKGLLSIEAILVLLLSPFILYFAYVTSAVPLNEKLLEKIHFEQLNDVMASWERQGRLETFDNGCGYLNGLKGDVGKLSDQLGYSLCLQAETCAQCAETNLCVWRTARVADTYRRVYLCEGR